MANWAPVIENLAVGAKPASREMAEAILTPACDFLIRILNIDGLVQAH